MSKKAKSIPRLREGMRKWLLRLCWRCEEPLDKKKSKRGDVCPECKELLDLRVKADPRPPIDPKSACWHHPTEKPRMVGNWAEIHEQDH